MRWLPCLVLCACAASVRPPAGDPARRALFRDLQRMVSVRVATGWQIDRLEVDNLLGDALQSVCRVEAPVRRALVDWIDAELARRGGSAAARYRQNGGDLGAVAPLIELERVRLLLTTADATADRDCPFHVTPEARFAGRQLADDRFFLVLEGGGKALGMRSGGRNDLAGGGAGRLLLARGLGARWLLATGIELGGTASFPRDAAGDRGDLELGVDVVVPLALRMRWVNTYLELEAGPLWRLAESAGGEAGFHLGVAVGLRSLRTRWITPGLALAASYEQTFAPADERLHILKLGLRVTFDIEL